MLVEGLTKRLADDVGLKALLSPSGTRSDGTNGIFPVLAPKEVNLPYVVYTQITGSQFRTLDGTPGLQSAGIQYSCYGPSYRTAKLVAQAVKVSLAGLAVTLPDTDATRVEGIWLATESDTQEEVPHAIIYGTMIYFDILFVDPETASAE